MNLRITNQPRQDYPFKGCKTIEDNTDSSEVVKCSPVKKNYKIPNKKEEQTVACFKKVVFCDSVWKKKNLLFDLEFNIW